MNNKVKNQVEIKGEISRMEIIRTENGGADIKFWMRPDIGRGKHITVVCHKRNRKNTRLPHVGNIVIIRGSLQNGFTIDENGKQSNYTIIQVNKMSYFEPKN